MAELFGVNVDTIGLHIRNIYREEELETSTYEESSVVRLEGKRQVKRSIRIYELDKSATCAENTQVQFEVDRTRITRHINNVFEENEVDINSNTQKMRIAGVDQRVIF